MIARLLSAEIPPTVLQVVSTIRNAGHSAFLVGGCVRDLLRGALPKDFDVATSATPAAIQKLFKRVIPTGVDHGTVTVVEKGLHVEVTTFRAESEYVDGRRPSRVEFHEDIEVDLSRRDFTINAMAWDPVARELIDPFDGQGDLSRMCIRCVRDPLERFSEDGLRALRAVRFSSVLGFTLDAATEAAIPRTLDIFRKVAGERIQQEFSKLLLSPNANSGLALLDRTGLLACFLFEALHADFEAVGRAPVDEILRLAVLLVRHPAPRAVVLRLKFPNTVADEVEALVHHRDLPSADLSDAELRRWLSRVTPRRAESLFELSGALGNSVDALKARVATVLSTSPPLSPRELALDGRAIMAALEVQPSRIVGEATRFLMDCVLDDPECNTPVALTSRLLAWHSEK
jgi:tRNA nucleotidyltransferase (CCA-adding enzyme)